MYFDGLKSLPSGFVPEEREIHHMNKAVVLASMAAAATACARSALATTLALNPVKDNTIYENGDGIFSSGAGSFMFVGKTNNFGSRRGLMEFDLSTVPAGATITSASLKLIASRTNSTSSLMELHRALQEWGEGTSNSSTGGEPGGFGTLATNGDATWLNTFYNSDPGSAGTWSTVGGSFSHCVAGSMTVTGVDSFTFSSSVHGVADVQSWLSPALNHGWFVIGDEAGFSNAVKFFSRESGPAGTPVLTINYAVPTAIIGWNVNSDGSWSTGGNWTGGTAPNAADVQAKFGSAAISAAHTVTVDSPQTVGEMLFDGSNAYTIAGPATITFQRAAGPGAITVASGTHTIAAPIVVTNSLNIQTPAAGAQLLITGPVSSAGQAINKYGPGLVQLQTVRADTLSIYEGTVRISQKATANSPAGTVVIHDLCNDTGSLDLTNNSAIIDYSTVGSLVSEVRTQLRQGRLFTSSPTPANTRLGYLDNASLATPKTSFAGQPVDPTSLLIKFTYAGDADLDGDADGVDIGTWATNFTGELGGGETATHIWAQGDWDYDGDVDGVDAGLWATAFTGELGGGGLGSVVVDDPSLSHEAAAILQGLGMTVVPEPLSLALPLLGAAWSLQRRRSR